MDYTHEINQSAFRDNHQLVSACCYQIAVAGEAVKRLSLGLRNAHREIPWKDIAGMRDRLIHGYDSVDVDELWKTSIEDIPMLMAQVRKIQTELGA